MPLFMDYHRIPGITLDEAKKAHLKDLAVQEKYNVKYHQFWVNEADSVAICLMEAPDKESCAATHREANGIEACNIIEVDGGMYSAFMSYNQSIEDDIVMKRPGLPDSGYRFIITIDVIALTNLSGNINFEKLKFPAKPKLLAYDLIHKYQGRILQQLQNDTTIATFYTPETAVCAAVAIKEQFIENKNTHQEGEWNFKFKMGISMGHPVTEKGDQLFEKAIKQSYRLCKIAADGDILVSENMGKVSLFCEKEIQNKNLKVINQADESFLERLFNIVEGNFPNEMFNVEMLSREIGLSRPQLYRKIRNIVGQSPISFIRNERLSKALQLIRKQEENISQVAINVGMSNTSYFAKCFQEKYGVLPSHLSA